MNSKRVDVLLVEQQLASSRTQAQRLVAAGRVQVYESRQWRLVQKPSEKLSDTAEFKVEAGPEQQFASRGGLKLQGALSTFGVDPRGLTVLDVGQSTGGFTDCLLQHQAARVVGVDVGRDQLVPTLRADPRVVCLEGINARQLPADVLLAHSPGGFPLAVMDVSFISQTLILPSLAALLAPGGVIVSLVKPQFEVGKAGVGKGGIVRDEGLYAEVELKLYSAYQTLNLEVQGYCTSPITGTDGNQEFFICARRKAAE